MTHYVRPEVDIPVYLDADGAPIRYGHRWDRVEDGVFTSSPPDDAYSVSAHPERFAPIIAVANALIEHLATTYDVTVDPHASTPAWMLERDPDAGTNVERTVVITPTDPQCCPLTLVETTYPSVRLRAGVQGSETFPDCGCDACDDDLQRLFESLERKVFAVVEGRFVERLNWRSVFTRWTYPDGWSGGNAPRRQVPRRDRAALKKHRRTHPDGWQPWPLRSA